MGQIADGLSRLFQPGTLHFIQQQGEQDRQREGEDQTLYRHDERVADGLQERGQGEQIHEVVEAHEFAGPDALENFEILKGDHQSAHGNILENNVPDSHRQKQQIQTDMILLESFSGSAAGLHRCSDSIPHCTHIL